MKLKLFVFLGIFSLLLVSFSAVLLVTKNVSGFDMFGSKKVDCVPYNVFLEKGEKDYSVKISWLTKAKCFGFVQYGMDSKDIDMIGVGSNSKAKEHSVIIEKISPSEKYFFLINSDDQTYGNGGVPLEFVLNNL
jgi:hypothetical protein